MIGSVLVTFSVRQGWNSSLVSLEASGVSIRTLRCDLTLHSWPWLFSHFWIRVIGSDTDISWHSFAALGSPHPTNWRRLKGSWGRKELGINFLGVYLLCSRCSQSVYLSQVSSEVQAEWPHALFRWEALKFWLLWSLKLSSKGKSPLAPSSKYLALTCCVFDLSSWRCDWMPLESQMEQ